MEAATLALEWSAAVAAGGALAGWLGLRDLRHARRLADVPLSRIRSAAQGYVELLGRPRLMPGPQIVSPLTGTPCYWWKCRVTLSANDDTEVIFDATSDDLFYLSDTTGDCIVDPVGATVHPNLARSWRGQLRKPLRPPRGAWDAFFSFGPYHYTEQLITGDVLIAASGWFRTQAAVQAADESRDLAALLGEWKRDRASLLRRFDANHDGRIDQQEWETARAAALEELRAARAEQQLLPDLNVLGQPPDGRQYLLSTRSRQAQQDRYRRRGGALLLVAGAAAAVVLLLLRRHGAA
ncbi:MAG TPA: hypothetical protein VFA75_15285 [Nevskia sp.]|nr:hypothetical protein [Nevskia sp.]